jgi:ABC-2 type transport system ATP-binding protein
VSEPIIDLKGLTKIYDFYTAVDRLTLQIEKGEVFGLLGPNGAGKSTSILMMLGLAEPTSGSARICGLDPVRQPLEVKARVGYLPDDVGFYEDRTGLENLILTARLNRISRTAAESRAEQLLKRVGLQDAARKKTSTYSRGMRQRLGLADVLIKQPDVIILDEPTLGIDPEGVREFLNLIRTLSRDEGLTVLLSSHHLHQVQQICDRVGLFVKGQLIAVGDVPTLSRKLFTEDAFHITLELAEEASILTEAIQDIEGVHSVHLNGKQLSIGCSKDLSPDIARIAVQAGANIMQLTKKEYGLDEIYHRYFEGGRSHGHAKKTAQGMA